MYAYTEFDRAFVRDRVLQYRDQVKRRLNGSLTEDEFKPLRLMNGVYLQLHAYMLRVAIPYGSLTPRQMRQLADVADRWDKGYGHVTTRQNVQFNWPRLIDTPDILEALADVDMHAIQTSGNTIRNVTTDQFAGAALDEVADPRPYAELIRQWSTDHPEFQFLPRKFKIAITGGSADRAVIRAHDIGLQLIDVKGRIGFRVFVGGGLGRTPIIGQELHDALPAEDLLPYLEAVLSVYNLAGRRDNKYKARIKITVGEMGIDRFKERVDAAFERLRPAFTGQDLSVLGEIQADFEPPRFLEKSQDVYFSALDGDAHFRAWVERNVNHEQNIVLPHVAQADLPEIYRQLAKHGLATANIGLVSDIIACPGMDYCALATARSIPIAQDIALRYERRESEIGDLKIKISGCINACGHHHVGHIGILGLDKAGVENYQVTVGGSAGNDAAIGQKMGRGFSFEELMPALDRLIDTYLAVRIDPSEAFVSAVERLGTIPFQEALYAIDKPA